MLGFALLADGLSDALQVLRHLLVGQHDFIKGVGDLAGKPGLVSGSRTEKSPSRTACSARSTKRRSSSRDSAALSLPLPFHCLAVVLTGSAGLRRTGLIVCNAHGLWLG